MELQPGPTPSCDFQSQAYPGPVPCPDWGSGRGILDLQLAVSISPGILVNNNNNRCCPSYARAVLVRVTGVFDATAGVGVGGVVGVASKSRYWLGKSY
jgi:hypothetical protein